MCGVCFFLGTNCEKTKCAETECVRDQIRSSHYGVLNFRLAHKISAKSPDQFRPVPGPPGPLQATKFFYVLD